MKDTSKVALLRGSAIGVVASLVAATAAWAQPPVTVQGETSQDQEEAAAVEELVIVGSRIRRDEFNTASPVQLITREESTMAGMASASEILQGAGVSGGQQQINNAFGGFVVDGGPGANTLGLRGLGANRTLILINGRRLAPAGTRGAVGSADLNVLPTAILDRIEILKDGASSIYGSDAVAGVVNVITKRGVDGWTLEGQVNIPEQGGAEEYRGSIIGGWTRGALDISGSFDYYERSELLLADRSWTLCNTDFRPNRATGGTTDFIDPLTGKSKCYPVTGTGVNGVTINTIGTNNIAGVAAPGTSATTFNRWRPNSAVTTGLVGFEGVGGTGSNINVRDTFEPRMLLEDIISPATNYALFLQGSYDMDRFGGAELYFELLGSRRQSSQTGYRQMILDYPKNSPLIPAGLQAATFSPAPVAPVITNGLPVGVRAFIGYGNDHSSQDIDYYKPTIGITGDFFIPGWRYDGYVNFSKASGSYTFESFITSKLSNSLAAVAAPVGMDPSLVRNGLTCAINITNPTEKCVVAPPLNNQTIGGILPEDFKSYVFRPVTGNTDYEQILASFTVDGDLWEMPYGTTKGAFGLEWRRDEINDQPDKRSVAGDLYNLTAALPTVGDDSVWEAYGEVEIPLLTDLPFAKSFTANLSARYTDYDSYGDDTTYKIGLFYVPVNWLSLRATYGTSYRAPAVFEQFQGATTGFQNQSNDPCNDYGSNPGTPLFANCASEGLPQDFNATTGIIVITAGGAAAGLAAETSKNMNIGLVLQPELPTAFGDLSFAVDYYDIEVTDEIAQVGGIAILDLCYNDPQFRAGGGFCNLVEPRAPNSNQLTVLDGYVNIASQIVRGYDFNLRWVKDIGEGELRLNAQVTKYIDQNDKTFPTDPYTINNGDLRFPEYTGALDATYEYKKWKFRYGVEWLSSMNSYEALFGPGVVASDVNFDFDVKDYYLHHASLQFTSTDDWQVTFGVQNLLDEEPPTISSGAYNRVGNAPLYSAYDYIGRTFFLNFTKKIK